MSDRPHSDVSGADSPKMSDESQNEDAVSSVAPIGEKIEMF